VVPTRNDWVTQPSSQALGEAHLTLLGVSFCAEFKAPGILFAIAVRIGLIEPASCLAPGSAFTASSPGTSEIVVLKVVNGRQQVFVHACGRD